MTLGLVPDEKKRDSFSAPDSGRVFHFQGFGFDVSGLACQPQNMGEVLFVWPL